MLFYRIGSKQRRLTLGRYPALRLDDARQKARDALTLVELGRDPATSNLKINETDPTCVSDVVSLFIDRYAKPKNRTWHQTQRMFERHVLPYWGRHDIGSITRQDVVRLLDRLVDDGTPIAANRVLANLKKLFSWAEEREIIDFHPALSVKAPAPEKERDRVLIDFEVKCIWEACNKIGGVFGPFIQMLLLTAQRRDEVAKMRWDDVELENRVWTIPRELAKADRSHQVPLSVLALQIIDRAPQIGPFVFMSGRTADRPISGFGKSKTHLDTAFGITGWRLHDLRRTAGTNLAQMGVPVHTISRILNHKEGGVTNIYNRYSYLDEKREGLENWAKKITSLTTS